MTVEDNGAFSRFGNNDSNKEVSVNFRTEDFLVPFVFSLITTKNIELTSQFAVGKRLAQFGGDWLASDFSAGSLGAAALGVIFQQEYSLFVSVVNFQSPKIGLTSLAVGAGVLY